MSSPIIYVCDHVFNGDREVSLVVHHKDGMWQLMCGENDHATDEATIKPVHIEHFVKEKALADVMVRTPAGHLSELRDGLWHTEAFNEEDD